MTALHCVCTANKQANLRICEGAVGVVRDCTINKGNHGLIVESQAKATIEHNEVRPQHSAFGHAHWRILVTHRHFSTALFFAAGVWAMAIMQTLTLTVMMVPSFNQ